MHLLTLAFSSDESKIAVMIPVIAIAGGLFVGLVGVLCGSIRKVAETRAREESRREIAAYVAEGTMSPDDAFKILSAGSQKGQKRCC
jgi:hypothetical protein